MSTTAISPLHQLCVRGARPQWVRPLFGPTPPETEAVRSGGRFRDENILTQICGNEFMVLKAAPPLVVREAQLDEFVAAIRDVVELAHASTRFRSEAPGMARRAAAD